MHQGAKNSKFQTKCLTNEQSVNKSNFGETGAQGRVHALHPQIVACTHLTKIPKNKLFASFCSLGDIFSLQEVSGPSSNYKIQENSPKKWDSDSITILTFSVFCKI